MKFIDDLSTIELNTWLKAAAFLALCVLSDTIEYWSMV